jgi:hypothetical protein
MAGEGNWQNECRDERGRWTSGSGCAVYGSKTLALAEGVKAALSGLPMAAHNRLDVMVASFDRGFLGEIAAAIGSPDAAATASGKADGASVLADTLNQVSINRKGSFGQANPSMIAALREVAARLQPGESSQTRDAAVSQLQDMFNRHESVDQLGQAMREVEKVKQANIAELARVLQNEAGSYKDQPIMEAVGHTVLNRMQRNGTALVTDVSGQYSIKQKPPAIETRRLATRLINGELTDTTDGATHFYQPSEMAHPTPVPTDGKGGYQAASPPRGYEYVPGVTVKGQDDKQPAFSVRPDWADGMRQVHVKGIPDSLAKFFIAPGSQHVR